MLLLTLHVLLLDRISPTTNWFKKFLDNVRNLHHMSNPYFASDILSLCQA